MQILQLGDTHLGMALPTHGGPPNWCRSHDHYTSLEQALAPALRQEVDLVVHTGDVFDRSRPPPYAVAQAAALFERVSRRVPVVMLAGNHDRWGLAPHFGSGGGDWHIVDRPAQLRVAGLRLGFVPHHRKAEDWGEAVRPAVRGGVDLLVCHQGFEGAWVPGFTFRSGKPAETVGEAQLPPDPIGAVMSGHLHPTQTLRWGPHTVVYAGSTERTSLSEAHQTKGSMLWSAGKRWSWRFVPGRSRPWMSCATDRDLNDVESGDLVSVATPRLDDLGPAVTRRGGIVVLPRKPHHLSRQQMRLF